MVIKRSTLLILIIQVNFILVSSHSYAQDCSDSAGMAAALSSRNEWTGWCTDCGGTVIYGPRCAQGPNWQGSGQTLKNAKYNKNSDSLRNNLWKVKQKKLMNKKIAEMSESHN